MLRVLIVESSKYSADLNVRELTRGGFDVVWERVESEKAMREQLDRQPWDVILSDHSTPMLNSIEALDIHNRLAAGTPFIIVSEDVSPDVLRYSMQNGCCAYLVRENLHQLAILVKKILESKGRDAAENPSLGTKASGTAVAAALPETETGAGEAGV
jgi:DNA-binding NtrC family response regulator